MERTAARGRLPLVVLGLLLGLLAMHGTATGHHSPATAPALAALADDHAHLEGAVAPQLEHAVHPAPAPLAGGDCHGCDDDALALLCLAVLTAGLALLAARLLLPAQRPALPAAPLCLPRLPTGPPVHLRPPDLVADLCVSRT